MNLNNIQRLVDILNQTPGITELSVTAPDGAKISVRRTLPVAPQNTALAVAAPEHSPLDIYESDEEEQRAEEMARLHTVSANIVGIFHCASPALGFGSTVSVGQIVGYIESMKLMNEVTSNESGTVAEVLIDENLPVEYGQPLFRLSTHAEG
jgi:biotin carboxyl carrier protein